jgi:hypothetical protein
MIELHISGGHIYINVQHDGTHPVIITKDKEGVVRRWENVYVSRHLWLLAGDYSLAYQQEAQQEAATSLQVELRNLNLFGLGKGDKVYEEIIAHLMARKGIRPYDEIAADLNKYRGIRA